MMFGRRAFLQFAAGAVGGTLLSPLPWKLADDSAIWSQNWSWRPSPERGPITKKATICTLCEGGCGIRARLVNGNRAVLLEGNPEHPINRGGICPLAASGLQFLYAPYRITQPIKQTQKRGEASGFKPIPWDEAMSELLDKLVNLRTGGTPHAVACITGQGQGSMRDLWQQFFDAYGSPNFFQMPSHSDSLKLAAFLTLGKEEPLAFALEKASYILSFGSDLIGGWGSPGRMLALWGDWNAAQSENKTPSAKIIQIESRCSMSAAKADRWIPIIPGSEAALALGIAHVMVKENLYDTSYVATNVFGFEDWTDSQGKARQGFKSFLLASENSLEEASRRTGLEPAKIVELAKDFATQPNAVAVWGKSRDLPEKIHHELAFLALNVLKGNLKSQGMISLAPSVPLGPMPQVLADEVAQQGLARKSLDQVKAQDIPLSRKSLYGFLKNLSEAPSYPIEVLMIHEANPAYSLPGNQVFQKAIQKVGWVVSFSSYMDETSLQADIILPNHTAFERYDDVIGVPGLPQAYYAVAAPILPPQWNTRHSGDVLLQMSKNMGGSVADALPWKSYDAFLQDRVKGLAASGRGAVAQTSARQLQETPEGVSPKANYKDGADLWKKLASGQCWYDAPQNPLQLVQSPSGKIELAFQSLQSKELEAGKDEQCLPNFSSIALSGNEKEYPLTLVSYQALFLSHGYLPNPPFMTKTLWDFILRNDDSFVELHPETARSLGLDEGNRAVLKTPAGECIVRVHLFPGARLDVIYMPQGLGHKAYDQYIQSKGANPNELLEVQMDPVSGLGTAWAARAQLRRA